MPMFILKPSDADITGANVATRTPTTGTNFDYVQLDFDATAQEHADWDCVMDEFYNSGTVYVDIYWKAAAITNNVVWQANWRGIADGEQFDGTLGSDFYVVDTAQGTTEYMGRTTITCASPGLAPRDAAILRISRDADDTNATDNMTGDAKLLFAVVRFNVAP